MKILVTGDFCPRDRVSNAFGRSDYASVLKEVSLITKEADYSIVNLECPIAPRGAKPINKIGPNLSCSLEALNALKYAGFDCITLANNHFLDYGKVGVQETLRLIQNNGFDLVGGGVCIEDASHTLYKEVKGERLAIINCCEHEFSIATETSAGSNPLNPIQQYYAIQEARKNADKVLVIVHGGHEHFQYPSLRMIETYRFFIDVGADAVVNHHQHCYSGYELHKGKPIFYGLGNFCFDKSTSRSGNWTEGFMVLIDFSSESQNFTIYPYQQCGEIPMVKMLPLGAFDKTLDCINSAIGNIDLLKGKINEFYDSRSDQYCKVIEPIQNRLYLAAKQRGILPSLISSKRTLTAFNYISCESHRDSLIHWLVKTKNNAK